ncbi:MAG: TSUP family transporter [Chitinophagaceae bacterium]|nr:TSUP family transporter [Chitinophagaceae bacterium]MCU0382523.1 TSUP family transporter [Cyclobacteriaceae bacterium]
MDNISINTTAPSNGDVNRLFPVFLKAEELKILICGGGPVALEKLQAIIKNSPSTCIKIVSIEFLDEIKKLAVTYENIELFKKPYAKEDLNEVNIVICAVNNIEKSKEIRRDAHIRNILVNVADTPELCDFYLSSIVTKGNLKIAISTNGKSPTIAKRVKEMLQEALPNQLSELLLKMPTIRKSIQGDFSEKVEKLNQITSVLINKKQPKDNKWRKIATYSLFVFAIMLIGHFIFSYIPLQAIGQNITMLAGGFDSSFKWMFLAGFLAQMVDGALGMGYGLVSISVLLTTGISPVAISGSIHTAEIFASGASGYSHYKFGNVNQI